jgi:Papain fold toxin 2
MNSTKNILNMELQEEIWQTVGRITINYPLLECDKCALTVMRWLKKRGIEAKILRLRTKRRSENFITSDRYGLDESITENGTHYGVEVMGKVFDNLSTEGLSREDWIKDFSCLSGSFIVDELTTL